ncbi:MAG: hypothetical protein H6608_10215 [Flavobacteriales bacterium]|nr:hypothetical protein [Flavobacteriales bacterium]
MFQRYWLFLFVLLFMTTCKREVPYLNESTYQIARQTPITIVRKGVPTKDGGWLVVGQNGNSPVIVKLRSDLSVEWDETYTEFGTGMFNDIIETSDGGYAAGGFSTFRVDHLTPIDIVNLVLKLSPSHQQEWHWTYRDSVTTKYDQIMALTENAEGQLVAVGEGSNLFGHFHILGKDGKYANSPNGHVYWFQTIIGSLTRYTDVSILENGNYYLSGLYAIGWQFRDFHAELDRRVFDDSMTVNFLNYSLDSLNKSSNEMGEASEYLKSAHVLVPEGHLIASYFSERNTDTLRRSIKVSLRTPDGGIPWVKKFYGVGSTTFEDMVKINDHIILLGSTLPLPGEGTRVSRSSVMAIDENGNLLWEHVFGPEGFYTSALSAQPEGNNIRILCHSLRPTGERQIIQYTLDPRGKMITNE